jgi:hypothetical protein
VHQVGRLACGVFELVGEVEALARSAAQARAQLEVRKVELAAAEGRLGQVMGLDAVEPK